MSNKPTRSASHSSRVHKASQAGQSRSFLLWIGLAAVVLVAGIVAIGVSRSSSSSSGGQASPSGGTVVPSGDLSAGSVEVEGAALPALATGSDPAVGTTIPSVTGEQFDGASVIVRPEGKPQVIMAMAHWCPHCQAEVPRIQEWLDDNGMPADVELVAVATSNDPTRPNYPAGDWLRREAWSVPTLVDDEQNSAATAFGVAGFPGFVAVDADGRVVQRASGEITTEQWEQLLEAARTGQAVA
ncbi:MAG: TlpA family protein disulfide reductase [Acidimicrobiales bacterium]|jgi:thiol-disulfide isomerase/thioredoxin|nr:TlpA family protein disulfide reductase [Acidimicrobiales bacterium]